MIEKQPEISIQSSQQKQRIQNVLHKQMKESGSKHC